MYKEVMSGVREYSEEMEVTIQRRSEPNNEFWKGQHRLMVCAKNEGGYSGTCVDLLDLIAWLKANKPELLE